MKRSVILDLMVKNRFLEPMIQILSILTTNGVEKYELNVKDEPDDTCLTCGSHSHRLGD